MAMHVTGHDRNVKVLRNLDHSDLLKTEIAHNTPIFTAVTRNHVSDQKSWYTAKITVITAIVNSWFSYSPIHMVRQLPYHPWEWYGKAAFCCTMFS